MKGKFIAVIIVLNLLFFQIQSSKAVFGVELGPLIAILQQIYTVSTNIKSGIDQVYNGLYKNMEEIIKFKNAVIDLTNLPSAIIGEAQSIINKGKQLQQLANKLTDLTAERKPTLYNLPDAINKAKTVNKILGNPNINLNQVAGLTESDIDALISLVKLKTVGVDINTDRLPPQVAGNPNVKATVDALNEKRNTIAKIYTNTTFSNAYVNSMVEATEKLENGLSSGLKQGELLLRQAQLIAIQNKLIAESIKRQNELIQIESIIAGYYVRSETSKVRQILENMRILEEGKKQ